MLGSLLTGSRLGTDPFDAHTPHQALNPFAVDRIPLASEPGSDPPASVEGRADVLGVDQPHQTQVLFAFVCRTIVGARARKPQESTLASETQLGMIGF